MISQMVLGDVRKCGRGHGELCLLRCGMFQSICQLDKSTVQTLVLVSSSLFMDVCTLCISWSQLDQQ